jgi:addiction module HigA family antidote
MTIARKDLKHESFKGIATGRKLAPVPPGSVLLADFIEPHGITRYRVAKAVGVQQRRIDGICDSARGVTAETAVRLGLAFGIEPQFWLNLQSQYDMRWSSASKARTWPVRSHLCERRYEYRHPELSDRSARGRLGRPRAAHSSCTYRGWRTGIAFAPAPRGTRGARLHIKSSRIA